jgi:hypothetical protein
VFYSLGIIALGVAGFALDLTLDSGARPVFAIIVFAGLLAVIGLVAWLNVNHPDKVILGERYRFRLLMAQARFGARDNPLPAHVIDALEGVPSPAVAAELPQPQRDAN